MKGKGISSLIKNSKITKPTASTAPKKPISRYITTDVTNKTHDWFILPHLIHSKSQEISTIYNMDIKICLKCFDLDGTLITTRSNKVKFATSEDDWKWISSKVPEKLREITKNENSWIVIFSNQGGVVANNNKSKSLLKFKGKVSQILKSLNNHKVMVYAAPKLPASLKKEYENSEKNPFILNRKPNIGMWEQLLKDLKLSKDDIDWENSIFVGDAAGRNSDFSDSDLQFAKNIGLRFLTPEEFF